MRPKTNLLFLSVTFALINPTFSAIFLLPDYEAVAHDYTETRNASPYRGLLLSYSVAKKKELCADIFSAQLYYVLEPRRNEALTAEATEDVDRGNYAAIDVESAETDPRTDPRIDKYITDGLNVEEPQFPLAVQKLGLHRDDDDFVEKLDINFQCIGRNFGRRDFLSHLELYVSSAYRPGWWNTSYFGEHINAHHTIMIYYATASPELVPLEQEKLEEQYANTQQIINALKLESPEYVHLIESKQLSSLAKWQQRHLCASILSSPTYRIDRLEYSEDWAENEENPTTDEITLAFKTVKYKKIFENSQSRCVVCEGFKNGDNDYGPTTNLYVIGSHDNKGSVYVLKEEEEGFFFNRYFKKVPILINLREPIKEMILHRNYV